MHRRLTVKLIAVFSCIILVVYGLTGYIAYFLHLRISEVEIVDQFSERMEQAAARMNLRLQDVYRWSDQLVINPTIVSIIEKSSMGEPPNPDERDQLNEELKTFYVSLPYLMSFYIFDLQGRHYMPSNLSDTYGSGEYAYSQMSGLLQETDGELVWRRSSFSESAFRGPGSHQGAMIVARYLKTADPSLYGILVIVIDESILTNDIREVIRDDEGSVYLFDRNHELLYTNESNASKKEEELLIAVRETNAGVHTVQGTPYLFAKSKMTQTGFQLMGYISMEMLRKKSTIIINISLISAGISAILAAILIVTSIRLLFDPLDDLVRAMRRVRQGNLNTTVKIRTRDELAYIGESFNQMIAHVHSLIKEVYEKQLRERQAELTALQAQINPHFLYNSLSTIYGKIYLLDDAETANLVLSLSKMLRYVLEPAQTESTVSVELEQIGNYLRLQKARFGNRLNIEIECQPEAMNGHIVRFLVLPVVENVFKHGFDEHADMMRLLIRIGRMDDEQQKLIIEIEDNGCGMDEQTVRTILRKPAFEQEEPQKGGIGLRNVMRRIDLMYGSPYGLTITSRPGEGTNIALLLPFRKLATGEKP